MGPIAREDLTMNAGDASRSRRRLEELRRRLRTDATQVVEQALGGSGGQAGGALSNAPFHLADSGSDEFLHDMSAALAENQQYLIHEVHEALRRLDEGSYGRCQECGKRIAAARLEAVPFARHCVTCAEKVHQGLDVNFNAGRPNTPADTLAPEGAMQEDWRPRIAATGSRRNVLAQDDHAVGEPGGGSAIGGLAGSNSGDGDPEVSDLRDAAGSGDFDVDEARDDPPETPRSGRSGGAVGGTPARKRAT
jgi:RNA polymerase-binding transcription factor DksA